MTVRAFQYADLAEIAELEKRCFSEAWSKEAFESSMRVPFCINETPFTLSVRSPSL